VGPDFVRPVPQVPASWSDRALQTAGTRVSAAPDAGSAGPAATLTQRPAELTDWWRGFADPQLDSLIERAVGANLDLRAALLRIDEARAQRAVTAAAFWPTVSADASYMRERFSETTPTGALFNSVGGVHGPGGSGVSVPNPYSQYQLSGSASWEVDLFGRVRRSVEAARAAEQVSVEDERAVLVSVVAEVAQSYMELRGAQERLRVSLQNLATIDELLDLTRQRRAAGLITHIDVTNAMAQSMSTRAGLPVFELEVTQSVDQLSKLLGREPEALRAELSAPAPLPPAPPEVPLGLPADLARRRPDVREAEANLHAATAQIGVAIAALFPRLTLTANGGFQSETTGNLLTWASRFGSVGPGIDLPLLDRGRWKTVHLNDVRAQEAALAYQRTVLGALHEVEGAVASYQADQQRKAWLESAIGQNRDALSLTRQRYEGGVVDFAQVLDVERTLQQNELLLADTHTALATDLVRLYRALGGGWEQTAAPEAGRVEPPSTARGPQVDTEAAGRGGSARGSPASAITATRAARVTYQAGASQAPPAGRVSQVSTVGANPPKSVNAPL
jgi:NodT family efflux transporter outer membrane factor (OMF) lipoprotein